MNNQDLQAFVDEMGPFNELFASMQESFPKFDEPGAIEQARAFADNMLATQPPPELAAQEQTIDGRDGPIPLRVFTPEQVDAVYLDLHGGGWSMGSAASEDAGNSSLALGAGVAVVSVDYRLAPENPWPAGADDCEDAALWLLDKGPELFGTERVVIGGASAGAHLAAVTVLRLRDQNLVDRVAGINFVIGAFDLSGTPSQRNATGWGFASWKGLVSLLLPELDVDEWRSPAISPLYADLHGLPPALFTAAALDPLRDDSIFMSALWNAAGNDADLLIFPECPHIFMGFPTKLAAIARERIEEFVRARARA